MFHDAEHFFDGWKANREFSLRVLAAAEEAGAEALVLCDTNGGTLPHEVEEIVTDVCGRTSAQIGLHFHNDGGCGVANTLTGVRMGATQVQGRINGYGERTGNADLCAAIPDLTLKMGVETIGRERLGRLAPVARHIAELVNVAPNPQQPYVGQSALATKAGLHTSAIARGRDLYAHADPEAVGNSSRVMVSELSGRSTVQLKAAELGLDLDPLVITEILSELKELEYLGYHFEVADGSLELLMRAAAGWEHPYFRLESSRVITEQRQAIGGHYPALAGVHLTDFKVRVLDTAKGTAAVTRVLIDSTDGERTWSTIGVSENIIEASWQALSDSIVYGLLHAGTQE